MQEFFMDYGLWLLIALLVVIALIFLLSTRRSPTAGASDEDQPSPEEAASAEPPVPDTPIMPAAPPEPVSPAVTAQPETVAPETAATDMARADTAPTDASDDLLKLKGIGPKLNMRLIELGVTRYAQIAGWSEADIAAIDAKLGAFKGRPVRDQWVDQARYLAAGDIAGFEAVYGKL